MLIKRCFVFIVCLLLMVSCVTPALASNIQETNFLWDESTGTSKVFDPNQKENIKLDPKPDKKTIVDNGAITPLAFYKVLDRYDQNSAVIDYKKKYVGTSRLDNGSKGLLVHYKNNRMMFNAN